MSGALQVTCASILLAALLPTASAWMLVDEGRIDTGATSGLGGALNALNSGAQLPTGQVGLEVPLKSLKYDAVPEWDGTAVDASDDAGRRFPLHFVSDAREALDGQATRLTREAIGAVDAAWTLQQAPQSCGLVWFNQSGPAVSEYEVAAVRGTETCSGAGGMWLGIFQFEESEAVDALFDAICAGSFDLSWLPLDAHIQMTDADMPTQPGAVTPMLPREARRLDAGGTAFMIARNTCRGPVAVEVRQSVGVRLSVKLRDVLAAADALMTAVVVTAAAALACAAVVLLRVWQQGRGRCDGQQALVSGAHAKALERGTAAALLPKLAAYPGPAQRPEWASEWLTAPLLKGEPEGP